MVARTSVMVAMVVTVMAAATTTMPMTTRLRRQNHGKGQ
jgi:hypothetical protein